MDVDKGVFGCLGLVSRYSRRAAGGAPAARAAGASTAAYRFH